MFGWAALAYGLDRLTKAWAEAALAGRPPMRVVPGVLHLRFTTNPGGAFGLFGGQPWLFLATTLVVCLAIVLSAPRIRGRLNAAGFGLILGGALGNLTDRILRGPGFSGRVVDFIDLQVWPVFNLADSAIVVGAALVVLAGLRRPS